MSKNYKVLRYNSSGQTEIVNDGIMLMFDSDIMKNYVYVRMSNGNWQKISEIYSSHEITAFDKNDNEVPIGKVTSGGEVIAYYANDQRRHVANVSFTYPGEVLIADRYGEFNQPVGMVVGDPEITKFDWDIVGGLALLFLSKEIGV